MKKIIHSFLILLSFCCFAHQDQLLLDEIKNIKLEIENLKKNLDLNSKKKSNDLSDINDIIFSELESQSKHIQLKKVSLVKDYEFSNTYSGTFEYLHSGIKCVRKINVSYDGKTWSIDNLGRINPREVYILLSNYFKKIGVHSLISDVVITPYGDYAPNDEMLDIPRFVGTLKVNLDSDLKIPHRIKKLMIDNTLTFSFKIHVDASTHFIDSKTKWAFSSVIPHYDRDSIGEDDILEILDNPYPSEQKFLKNLFLELGLN